MEPGSRDTFANPGPAPGTMTTEKVAGAAHSAVDKVADSARPAVDRLAAGAHATVDRVAAAAGDVAGTVAEKTEQWKATQDKMMENCREYVRENPVTSLGIAVAVGFVLSRLISLR